MSTEYLQGFYLGEVFVEPLKGQVSGRNATGHLSPKAVEVLLCLARTPGDLVTRDFLLEEVWGRDHGSHTALSHAVSEIRHALGDHAENPVFIQTIPKRGYRLAVSPESSAQFADSGIINTNNNVADLGLFDNLRRRGVLETALAYLIFGWLLIQVADIVFDQLHFPPWAGTFVTVLVIAGFPIAIVLSWFLEVRNGRAVLDELSPRDSRRRRFGRTYMSIVSGLAVATILVFFFDREFGLPVAPEPPAPATETAAAPPVTDNSIAVLPFMNVDGSDKTRAFTNGLVDDVINRLARVPGLRVSSRGDSFTLAPNSPSALVRRRLRVAMYIEGSVEIAGDAIRVTVQLINSADGFHIQSRTFNHALKDFFQIRDEITELTVSSLRVTLPNEIQEMSRVESQAPDLDAYILYRRGMEELHKPGTVDSLSAAIGWMDAALEVDQEFAAAYAGKCRAFVVLYRETDDPSTIESAKRSCANALTRDPNLDIVHTALGSLYSQVGQYKAAESSYLRALEINAESVRALTGLSDIYRRQNRAALAEETLVRAVGLEPGNWKAYSHLGYFYYRQGRYDEAATEFAKVVTLDNKNMRGYGNLAASHMMAGNFAAAAPAFQRSIDLDSQPSAYSNLGLMQYYLGQYDAAAKSMRSAIKLEPSNHLYRSNLGDILWHAGRRTEARNAFLAASIRIATALEVNPNDPALMMDHAWILAMLGNKGAALAEIHKASERLPDDPYADYIQTLIHTHYGDFEAAFAALEVAAAKGTSVVVLGAEPHLAPLRNDPRFVDVVGQENIRK